MRTKGKPSFEQLILHKKACTDYLLDSTLKVTLAMSGLVIQEERTDSECKSRSPLADWSAECSQTGRNTKDHPGV